mmetsp:Transcript_27620/g.74439  ORF Transcript_27620/g.74439 Transcript_27620/m.74439 type:complete len:164 (-) Transcript_27620:468-959(-)
MRLRGVGCCQSRCCDEGDVLSTPLLSHTAQRPATQAGSTAPLVTRAEVQRFVTAEPSVMTAEVQLTGCLRLSSLQMKMVERLFHGCSRVIIAPLAGGLSGSLVLTADSYDAKGQREEPTVLKLDKQKEMVGEEVAQTRYIHKLVDKGVIQIFASQSTSKAKEH